MTEYYRDPVFSGNEAEKEREELRAQQQAVEVARQHYFQSEEATKSYQDKEAES